MRPTEPQERSSTPHHRLFSHSLPILRFSRPSGQYYQIYNPTGSAIALSGYTHAYCANGCANGKFEYKHAFATNATIAASGTYTVCNNEMPDTTGCDETHGYPSPAVFDGDDFHALILGTFSDITTAPASSIVDQIGLFSADDPGSSWPICGSSSGMDTRNGQMRRKASTQYGDNSGVAFDGTDLSGDACPWTEPPDTDAVASWPGTADMPAVQTIEDLQSFVTSSNEGTCHSATLAGTPRTTTGYVVGVDTNGFYMQSTTDGVKPGTAATSYQGRGLWVYLKSGVTLHEQLLAAVKVGYKVQVSSMKLKEYYGLTEFDGVSAYTILSSTPAALTPLPITTGMLGTSCNPSGERFEGMLVKLSNVEIKSEPNQHDEISVDDGTGQTQLDDGIFNTDTHLVATLGAPLMGKKLASVTGVVSFAYGSFEVHARSADDIVFLLPPSPMMPPPIMPAPSPPAVAPAVVFTATISGNVDSFNSTAYAANLARLAGVSVSDVAIKILSKRRRSLQAGTFSVEATIIAASVEAAKAVQSTIAALSVDEMSSSLGVTVVSFVPPEVTTAIVGGTSDLVVDSSAAAQSVSGNESAPNGAVIGGVVGGVVGFLLLVAIVVIVVMARRNAAKPPSAVLASGVPVEMMDPTAHSKADAPAGAAEDKI